MLKHLHACRCVDVGERHVKEKRFVLMLCYEVFDKALRVATKEKGERKTAFVLETFILIEAPTFVLLPATVPYIFPPKT